MEKEKAWKKFSQSGLVSDYLEYRSCVTNSTSGVKTNENDHRRTCTKGDGYR